MGSYNAKCMAIIQKSPELCGNDLYEINCLCDPGTFNKSYSKFYFNGDPSKIKTGTTYKIKYQIINNGRNYEYWIINMKEYIPKVFTQQSKVI
jgi:hypothetical protein